MRVLKRVLTRKSILNFGYADYRDLSVQMILDLSRHNVLINAYFNLEKIDFTQDILDELGITSEFKMVKPNKDRELGKLFYKKRNDNYSGEERIKYWSIRNSIRKDSVIRKNSSRIGGRAEFLRSKNHGNR